LGNNVTSKNQEKAFDVLWDNTTYKAINTYREGKYNEVTELAKQVYGNDSTKVAISMNNLSLIYDARGKFEETEFYFKKGLIILEKVFGTNNNPNVTMTMLNLAEMYESQGRTDKAKRYSENAKSIFKKNFKSD